MTKPLLDRTVEHIDITRFNPCNIMDQMSQMSFSARSTGDAAKLFNTMIADPECSIILSLAGSTSAAGCMKIYADMITNKMADAVVATGASIVDMDFFEALGYRHYHGTPLLDDNELREQRIDRIYDTLIDEDDLQGCDKAIEEIANSLEPRAYSSREFIWHMGKYLAEGKAKKTNSLVELAYKNDVPVFCPAFVDSSAGFGLVKHQVDRIAKGEPYVTIDGVADFRELTLIKIAAGTTGLLMIGGGVPKNFVQDTVVCAEFIGKEVAMHKYAIQVTVADPRDGACSSSTLREASSWGKVSTEQEQMVFSEASLAIPLIVGDAYHRGHWINRTKKSYNKLFEKPVELKEVDDANPVLRPSTPIDPTAKTEGGLVSKTGKSS